MLVELSTNVRTMASQPARSLRRSKSSVKGEVQGPQQKMKLADAMKTKAASIGVENTIENQMEEKIEAPAPADSMKRTGGQAHVEVTSPPSKRRKIKKAQATAPAVEQAPAKIPAPRSPARQKLKTYASTRSRSTSAQPAAPRSEAQKAPTVSQNKVANGIKHELERLGVAPIEAGKKDEKRKLRSEGRAKFKSELGVYFPEYEVIMGNEEAVETSTFTRAVGSKITY